MVASSDFLERVYENTVIAARTARRRKHESLLISLLEVKSNVRFNLLQEGALHAGATPQEELRALVRDGLLLESSSPYVYALSGKGIWEVESNRNILSPKQLLEYLDSKHFQQIKKVRGLSSREKLILLGLIASRSYSEDQPVDLGTTSDATKDKWLEIYSKCYDLLDTLNEAKGLERERIFERDSGNEHVVSHLVRHSDQIPRKTRGLFKTLNKQRYCLQVSEGNHIHVDDLAYLFQLILPSEVTPYQIEETEKVLRNVAYDDCIYIFDVASNPFIGVAQDESVRLALRKAAEM